MELRIEVLSYKGCKPSEIISISFDEKGGTIGRSPENDLHLHDPVISSRHASITYENDAYFITDHSTNGTFFLQTERELRSEKARLTDGDKLELGDHIVGISIMDNANHTPSVRESGFLHGLDDGIIEGQESKGMDMDVFLSYAPPDPIEVEPPPVFNQDLTPENHLTPASIVPGAPIEPPAKPPETTPAIPPDFNAEDLLGLLGPSDKSENDKPENEKDIPPLIITSCPPPPPQKIDVGNDADFSFNEKTMPPDDFQTPPPNKPPPYPAPRPPQSPPADMPKTAMTERTQPSGQVAMKGSGEFIRILFDAMGLVYEEDISPGEVTEFINIIGTVFKELTDGLRTILRARAEIKSEIGIQATLIERRGNNPLKFSPTVEDALKLMLIEKNSGFMDAVTAVRDSYKDVKNHQIAVNAGVQATLKKLLIMLDPQHFEEKFDKAVLMKKAKCWDEYCKTYGDIVKENPERFFDKEFARAYEDLISKIDDASKKKRRPLKTEETYHHE